MIDLTKLTIDRQLGAGSQGKVFLATDPEGTRFTVKLVVLDDSLDRGLLFERASVFRLDLLDQAIVPILSHGMVSNTPISLARQLGKMSRDALVLVMPYVAGTTLADIETQGDLTLQDAVAALTGIAAALAKLPPGVGHGDLRAPNIFIRPSGEIALADPDLSTSNPDPAGDVRALAAIGMNLAKIAAPSKDALAIGKLRALIGEIAGPGTALSAADAARQLGEIAVLLGAPEGNVTSVLAKRAQAGALKPAGTPMSTPTVAPVGRQPRSMIAFIAIALVLLAAATLLVRDRLQRRSPITAQGSGNSLAPASGESLYDTTGTVHYAEAIHRLGPNEHVAANDGVIHVDIEDSIPRIAILSARKDVLWELRTPPAGTSILLDAKPGHYQVEQDRDLGDGRIQPDLRLVEIDFQHPLGITTTRALVNSPRPPEGDGGVR